MRSTNWRPMVCVEFAAAARGLGVMARAPYAPCVVAKNCVTIAASGGIEPLIALLVSPSVHAQCLAAQALRNLAWNNGVCHGGGPLTCGGGTVAPYARAAEGENVIAIAAAGGIGPLIALLGSPSAKMANAAAGALRNLADSNGVWHGGGARTYGGWRYSSLSALPQTKPRPRSLPREASIG